MKFYNVNRISLEDYVTLTRLGVKVNLSISNPKHTKKLLIKESDSDATHLEAITRPKRSVSLSSIIPYVLIKEFKRFR